MELSELKALMAATILAAARVDLLRMDLDVGPKEIAEAVRISQQVWLEVLKQERE